MTLPTNISLTIYLNDPLLSAPFVAAAISGWFYQVILGR